MDKPQSVPVPVQEVTPEMISAENARLQTVIEVQRQKLAVADDLDTTVQAAVIQRDKQIEMFQGMLTQISAENRVLRKRLGIGESEPIPVDDEEDAEEISGAVVHDLPVAGEATHPSQEDAAHHHA